MSKEQQEPSEINTSIEHKQMSASVDLLCKRGFQLTCGFVKNVLGPIIKSNNYFKQLVSSDNNSKPINQNTENITRMYFLPYLEKENINAKPYIGPYVADTPIELENENCVLQIDSKGLYATYKKQEWNKEKWIKEYQKWHLIQEEPKKNLNGTYKLNMTIEEMKKQLQKYCHSDDFKKMGKTIIYDYKETYQDHKDENLHFKSSQSNLSGFKGKCDKKLVEFNGKVPSDTSKPHFTYVIKHVYTQQHGITKIIVYSIPHCSYQKEYYPDIQKEKNKNRIPKASDEFRFNMNNEDGTPYTFIGCETPRYTSFILQENIKYS